MFRFLFTGAMLASLVAPAVSRAADAPAKSGPSIMLRVQSVDQLLTNGEYLAGLAGQDEVAKQMLGTVRSMAGDKGIEGVDITKPFLIYANLDQNIVNSEAVVMVPIKDKDLFVGLLKNKVGLTVNEEKGGLFSTELPNNMGTVYFRFANDYVYATYLNKANIDATKLVKPADLFGKDDSVVSLSIRVDRFPDEMKKFALGTIEDGLAQAKEKPLDNETKDIKALKDKFIDGVAGHVKQILFEAESVTLKLTVDSKQDELMFELAMTPMPGGPLAKDIAELKTKKSVALGSLTARNTAFFMALNASLPANVKKVLGPAVDDLVKMGLEKGPIDEKGKEVLGPLLQAILPTAKAGDFDGGTAMFGPNADGKYTVVVGGKLVDGKDLEKASREAVKKLPPDVQAAFDWGADAAGDTTLNAIRVGPVLDEKMRKLFGETDVWFAFRNDAVFVAVGPEAKEMLKGALAGKPAPGAIFQLEVALKRLLTAIEVENPRAAKIAAKTAFGKDETGDTVAISLEAGDSLRFRAVVKGKVVKFIAAMEKAKKGD
jgi:hypothetical protein